MAKKILITRPKHDMQTSYLNGFSKKLVNVIKQTKDIHLTNLEGSKATRKIFEKIVKKENPGLIFLNGHGNKKCVCGHNDEVILDNNNIYLTKAKIVYALACDSLEELGKIAVKQGTKTYIGYKAKFMVVRDLSRANPDKDKNALPFKRACFCLINALISGYTVAEAIQLTKNEYISSIRSYGTSEDDPYGDAPLIRFALMWDLEFLDCFGDETAIFA